MRVIVPFIPYRSHANKKVAFFKLVFTIVYTAVKSLAFLLLFQMWFNEQETQTRLSQWFSGPEKHQTSNTKVGALSGSLKTD